MNKFSKGIGLLGGILIIFIGGVIVCVIIAKLVDSNAGGIISGNNNSASSQSVKKTSLTIEEVKKESIELSYDELLRNNDKYVGKIVHYRGEINQVVEGWGNNYYLRAYVTKGQYGFWDDDIFVNYEGKRFLENDVVDIWGEVKGIKKYTTILGASRSIPEIDAFYIELASENKIVSGNTSVAPAETPIGFSRQKPASIGTPIITEINGLSNAVKAEITLLDIIHGTEAWDLIKKSNMFNDQPKSGYDYLLAKIKFNVLESQEKDAAYSLSAYSFIAVSSDGKDYDSPSVVKPDPKLDANLYEGASHAGWVAFQVAKNDTKPLMTFNRAYDGTGGVWFKLY